MARDGGRAGLNPAAPPAGTVLCRLEALGDPAARGFRFRDGDALFAGFVLKADGQVRGFVDSCPHSGWPLAVTDDRYLTREKDRLLCSGHGALFGLDGVCVAGPCVGRSLEPWPVEVRDGEVVVA